MMAITIALTILGLAGLAAAMFLPARWKIKYSLEFVFIAGLFVMAWYGDWSSTNIYTAYQNEMIDEEGVSGKKSPKRTNSLIAR